MSFEENYVRCVFKKFLITRFLGMKKKKNTSQLPVPYSRENNQI